MTITDSHSATKRRMQMDKRYAVFAYDEYYPAGGWNDFVDAFEHLEDAKAVADAIVNTGRSNTYADVVDLETLKEVDQ